MTEEFTIEIRDYEESLSEDIAAMWNTWDELWPGGFTQGVPYTAERVHKQLGKSDALAILIAIDHLANAILFGDPGETISSRIGKNYKGSLLYRILNRIDKNHCEDAVKEYANQGDDSIFK